MTPPRWLWLLLLTATLGVRPAPAQVSVTLRPVVEAGEGLSPVTVGVGFDAAARHRATSRGGTRLFGEAAATGAVLLDPALNTRPLVAALRGGGVWLLYEPVVEAFDPDAVDADAPEDAAGGTDRGRIDLAFAARYETDQTFDEQQGVAALELGYVNLKAEGWQGLIPSVVLAADGVLPLTSEARDGLGLDDDVFVRLRGQGSVNWRFGASLPSPVLRPLGLRLAGDLALELGVDEAWEVAGLDDAAYGQALLSYNVDWRSAYVYEVFAGVGAGRVPPETVSETKLIVGLILSR